MYIHIPDIETVREKTTREKRERSSMYSVEICTCIRGVARGGLRGLKPPLCPQGALHIGVGTKHVLYCRTFYDTLFHMKLVKVVFKLTFTGRSRAKSSIAS